MVASISTHKNTYAGAEIYCLGAGASLNYLDPAYFADKLVVAVNESAQAFGIKPLAIVLKEHRESLAMAYSAFPDVPLIVSRWPYGDPNRGFPPLEETPYASIPTVAVFDHEANQSGAFDAERDWPTDPDALVVSMSTITSAMHFAAYLGAKTIILVGHDCGQVGTEGPYVKGYGQAEAQMGYAPQQLAWLTSIERQSRAVKAQLVARYGVSVLSLSPFLSPHMDGVPFDGGTVQINMPA